MKQYCFHCMEELAPSGFCPSCRRPNTPDNYPHHLKPGTVLNNKYLVGNCLGEGGFGITYIGRDLTLDIKVAVKEYFPNGYVNRNNAATQLVTATSEQQRQIFEQGKDRFLMEARSLARFIGEPGIVDVRDFFEANNTAYIIMEYLEGVNLSSYIKQNGKMAPETAFRMMLPIADSLQRIHQEGLIHRDISPENIMLTKKNKMVLMDFGSARYFSNKEKQMSVMLKEGYAPEEQYRKNGNQGPWTDVYALCATMYRCITGVIPVDALDRMRQDELRKPSELGVRISEPMEAVLMYGLAVFQENRCHDMAELSSMMQKALNNQSVEVNQGTIPDMYRTHLMDNSYKAQAQHFDHSYQQWQQPAVPPQQPAYQNNSYPPVPPQQGYRNDQIAPANMPAPQQPAPSAKKGPSMKAVIAVVVASVLVIIGAMAAVIIVLSNSNNNVTPVSSSATASATSASTASSDGGEEETEAPEEESQEENVATKSTDVEMPACVDYKLSVAKKKLEDLGLSVKVTYRNDSSTPKDYVIEQSPAQGTSIAKGTAVALVISKGSAENPHPYSQKLVVTASGSYGTATFYEWEDGDFVKKASYSCSVGKNGIGAAREGSSTTPRGQFDLGVLLTSRALNTRYNNTYIVTRNTVVVDDTSSPQYNMILEKSAVRNNAHTDGSISGGLISGEFNAIIYINHNGNGFSSNNVVRGNGSAIGLRGKYGSLSATFGDVDISADDMADLLGRLDSSKNPQIFIGVE